MPEQSGRDATRYKDEAGRIRNASYFLATRELDQHGFEPEGIHSLGSVFETCLVYVFSTPGIMILVACPVNAMALLGRQVQPVGPIISLGA
jgi:hypothetical protein